MALLRIVKSILVRGEIAVSGSGFPGEEPIRLQRIGGADDKEDAPTYGWKTMGWPKMVSERLGALEPVETVTTAPSGWRLIFATRRSFALLAVVVAFNYVAAQFHSFTLVAEHLNLPDNDDMIRLVSVRNWLSGQSWFDMTVYSMAPPEGLSLHWSRYVDAGIAGLQGILGFVLDRQDAERWAVVMWPPLVLVIYATISAAAMTRTYGLQAASFTLFALGILAIFPFVHFTIGRIDHHNVQIVLMMASTVCLFNEGKPVRWSVLSGILAALSLAVGLESLVFFGTIGLFLVGIAVLGRHPGRHQLLGFGLGLGLAAPMFFVGQTPPDKWGVAYCDALSLPVLWLSTVGLAFATLFYGLSARSETVLGRALIAVVLAASAALVLLPQVQSCFGGPYGALPEDLRRFSFGQIVEVRPVTARSDNVFLFLVPALASLVAVLYALWAGRAVKGDGAGRRGAWLLAVLLACTSSGMVLQLRFAVSVYAVLPLAFGFAATTLLRLSADGIGRAGRAVLATMLVAVVFSIPLALAATAFVKAVSVKVANGSPPSAGAAGRESDTACRGLDALSQLDKLPPTRVLTSVNLAPALALHTHHVILSAPFHRSTTGMDNAFRVMALPETQFIQAARLIGADLLVLCQGVSYGPFAMTSALASGETRAWAQPVQTSGPLRVFALELTEVPQ